MQWQPQTLESSQVSAGGSLIDVGEATTPGSEARSTRARSASIVDQFEDIRPYRDEELADKLAELSEDLTLIRTVCTFTIPRLYRMFPAGVQWLWRRILRNRYRNIHNIKDLQDLMGKYVGFCMRRTSLGLTTSGLEHLPSDRPCLFISNHRDIVLDSAIVVVTLGSQDVPNMQIAIGDNLFESGWEKEIMRLNRGFMVVRRADSRRAQYEALVTTSKYIRHTLEQGESVWISQRQGRSKDGLDKTDPALIKMLLLAYRDEISEISDWLEHVYLVPISVSYEVDPCAPMKAMELYTRETTGTYEKDEREDFRSIVQGIRGFKGRVHLAFSEPIKPEEVKQNGDPNVRPLDADDFALRVDDSITNGLRTFPTFYEAQRLLSGGTGCELERGPVQRAFEKQCQSLEPAARKYLYMQYANQIHHSR